MRLFIAIYPPKEHLDYMRDMLRMYDKQKRNLIKIPIDQLHLTLKFLGSKVTEDSKDIIAEELQAQAGNYTKPIISLDKMSLGFPKEYFPKILMMNVHPEPTLNELADEIHEHIKQLKLKDTIRWKGRYTHNHHITLARLKDSASKSTSKLIFSRTSSLPETPMPKPFEAQEMYLVKSEMITYGTTTYTKLEKITL